MCCLQFEALEVDRCDVPLAVMYVDHNTLQLDSKDMEAHRYLKSFCERFGLLYSRPGNGISHYVHLERFSRPGALLLGADSHTTAAGARRQPRDRRRRARGGRRDGRLSVLDRLPRGRGRSPRRRAPRVGAGEGRDPRAAAAVRRARRASARSSSSPARGSPALSATERATICNMIVETGATTAVFPSDERVREWLSAQGREDDFVELAADPGAEYDALEVIDLADARAADSEAALARERRAGRGAGRDEDRSGLRRLLGQLVLRGPRHRRGGAAATETLAPGDSADGDARLAPDPRHDRAQRRLPRPRRRRRAPARARLRPVHRRRSGPGRRACRRSGRSTGTSPGAAGLPATRSTSARLRRQPRPLCAARSRTHARSGTPPRDRSDAPGDPAVVERQIVDAAAA